jgi:type IV secretion system protein TrbL
MTIEQAFAVVLGALTLMGLAIFCPRIAAGLVSGAPQLSAGAAAGTLGVGAAGMPALTWQGVRRQRRCWRHARGSKRLSVRCRRPSRGNRAGRHAHRPLRSHRAPLNAAVGLGASAAGGLARQQAVSPVTSGRVERQASALLLARPVRSRPAHISPASHLGSPSSATSRQPAWANRFKRTQAIREGVLLLPTR